MRPSTDPSARWPKIEELFHAAAELPGAERAGFLERACAGDPALRREVEALLASDEAAGGFIEHAIGAEAGQLVAASTATTRRLGPYRIVGELGHGGMAAVFLAVRDDDQYLKQVAVKLLQRGLVTEESVARFRDERQMLAAFEHPGIVRLLDGGSTEEGLPYLVMEHVEGIPITDHCDRHGLSVRDRLILFRQVCAAVQYAHQRLVVHRDIKPSNILVGADGMPKLLDFGIAKLLGPEEAGRQAQTRTGMHLLTPEYGSPEQARGDPVTTATDVYSLGAVLYELLTGVRPHRFDGDSVEQMLRTIREVDAPRPSDAAPAPRGRALRGDLDNIVLKALHKEPDRRYASVEQLSEDLRRYLDGHPVAARAATWTYRAGKFVRRRRGVVAAVTAVIATLAIGTVVSLQQARRAQRRFTDVRHLANSLLFEVDERIQGLEGSTAARELIVTRALQYLDSLSREAGEDAALWHELATAYMKVGDIQGSSRAPSLGRPRDGIESYRRARQILERLAASGQDDPGTQWSRARALYRLGDLYRLDNQLAHARTSLLEAGQVVERIPKTAGFDYRTVIAGLLALFGIEEQAGHPAAMAECAERLRDVAREMAQTGDAAESRYWMGIAHEMAGFAHSRAADVDAALGDYDQARATFEVLVKEYPENAAYRRELSLTLARLGSHHSGIGETSGWEPGWRNTRAAEELLRESVRLREVQAERDPDDQRTAVELANRVTHLAATLAVRSPEEAIGAFERAVQMHRRLPPATRGSGYSRQLEWYTHCSRAEPLARIGRGAEARDAIAEGLALVEEDVAHGSFERRLALLTCRYQVARARRVLGTPHVAEQLHEVTAGLQQLISAQPSNIVPYVGLIETLVLLADLRPGQRCALYERADAGWRSWAGPATSYTDRRQAELGALLTRCRSAR